VKIPEPPVFADRRGILAYSYLPGFGDDWRKPLCFLFAMSRGYSLSAYAVIHSVS
jgi:hypothetical protein